MAADDLPALVALLERQGYEVCVAADGSVYTISEDDWSLVRYDAASLRKAASVVDAFARMERLDAHGRSLTVRLDPKA